MWLTSVSSADFEGFFRSEYREFRDDRRRRGRGGVERGVEDPRQRGRDPGRGRGGCGMRLGGVRRKIRLRRGGYRFSGDVCMPPGGLVGMDKYDYKYLCTPSLPWTKGGVEPPQFLSKDERLPLVVFAPRVSPGRRPRDRPTRLGAFREPARRRRSPRSESFEGASPARGRRSAVAASFANDREGTSATRSPVGRWSWACSTRWPWSRASRRPGAC